MTNSQKERLLRVLKPLILEVKRELRENFQTGDRVTIINPELGDESYKKYANKVGRITRISGKYFHVDFPQLRPLLLMPEEIQLAN